MASPQLSRQRNPALPNTDLYCRDIPKELVDMLDAQGIPLGISRREALIRLLRREAKRWAHEQIVAQRVMGGNSVLEQLAAAELEDEPQIGG